MLAVGAQQKLHGRELLTILVDCACQPEVQEQGGKRQRNQHADQPHGALRGRITGEASNAAARNRV